MVEFLTDKDKEQLLQKIKEDRIIMKSQKMHTQESERQLQKEKQFYDLINDKTQQFQFNQHTSESQNQTKSSKTNYHNKTLEEYQQQQQHSFQPKINNLDQDIYKHVYEKNDNQIQKNKVQIWERLLETKDQIKIEREQQYNENNNKQIEQQCTFKPKINEISQKIAEKDNKRKDETVQHRLFNENQEKIFNKDKLRNQYINQIDKDLKKNNEKQQIILKGEKNDQKPLHERVDTIVKQKKEKMQQILLSQEQKDNQQMSFQPQIDEKSKKIFDSKCSNVNNNVIERLQQYNDLQKQNIQQLIQKNIEEQSKEYTFKPQINNYISNQEQTNNTQSSFINRQQQILDDQREKQRTKNIQAQQQECQPHKINQLSNIIVQCDLDRINENQVDQADRLSKQDQQKQNLLKKQIREGYYQQYDHQPKINKISKTIGVGRNNKEQQVKERQKNNQKKLQIEQQKMQECHFKPKMIQNKKYQYIESKYKQDEISDNINTEIINKQLKLEKIKQEAEYKELEDCTFQPKIKNKKPDEQIGELSDYVKGMERVMETREKAKVIQQQKEDRHQSLFNLQDKYDYQKHTDITKVIPFRLSQQRQAQLGVEEEEVEKRQILRRIIQNIQD